MSINGKLELVCFRKVIVESFPNGWLVKPISEEQGWAIFMNMDEKPFQAEIIMTTNIRVLREEPAWTASLERHRMRRVRHEAEQVI